MQTVKMINLILMFLFFACYMYQFLYIPIAWMPRKKSRKDVPLHRFAVLIAARNEETVIAHLLESIRDQSYPARFVKVFVVADNCTDRTAEIARRCGAEVYERKSTAHRGKGYALDFLLREMKTDGYTDFDAYLVFDADNLLDRDFILHMNETFSEGKEIITCYRNSKNYGDNWISAGNALCYLRESRYLNDARSRLGVSCSVTGTGFLFSKNILASQGGGWPFHLLTEDSEFTMEHATHGRTFGYCADAVLYDEQTVRFSQSWAQRLRWSRGYLQVFRKYGARLVTGIFRGSFSCYDMTMSIMPAAVLSVAGIAVNLGAAVLNVFRYHDWSTLGTSVLQIMGNLCITVFILGAVTTISEWRRIRCPAWKKIAYIFTFPFFMLTYIPIVIESFFVTPEWTPITHTRDMSIRQMSTPNYRDAG